MLLLYPFASFFLVLTSCEADQSQPSGFSPHDLENIAKMKELSARWYSKHPVIFQPLNAEAQEYLEAYAKNHVANVDDILSNPELYGSMAGELIEGDIIPSDDDIAAMEEQLRIDGEQPSAINEQKRYERAAPYTHGIRMWDKSAPIPFVIDSRIAAENKALIRAVLQTMNENTCLTFEENAPGRKLEYFMEAIKNACSSEIGDIREWISETQKIHLGYGCFTINVIQHETMHALGFDHSQSRTDRDDFVQIDFSNIKEKEQYNFDKLNKTDSSTNYGIPYEYASIMHYPMNAGNFQIDETKPAILPKDLDYERTVSGSYPIFNDWKMINVHYKCNETCAMQIECRNGGYQHPRRCNECVCPQFHNGTFCEFERDVVFLQPGVIEMQDHEFPYNETTINDNSLNYTSYLRSPARLFKGPDGSRIRITIANITGRGTNQCPVLCDTKAVEIVDGDLTRVGKRFCCNKIRENYTLPYSFLSSSNVVGWVVFARPGLDFYANVTFEVVNSAVFNGSSSVLSLLSFCVLTLWFYNE